MHLSKPNLSGGHPAKAKSVVMSAFYIYTDSVTRSASNVGAKLRLFKCKNHCWCGIQGSLIGWRKLMFLDSNMFLGNDFHLDSSITVLQQYHWITGWWQPRYEHSLSFVEDDKLRPGEDVTSVKRRCKSL